MHGCLKAQHKLSIILTEKKTVIRIRLVRATNELLGHSTKREVVETYVAKIW
jgi:hypothetical protein